MPGKYSHSVVLADYSTRGVISLPPDQHSRYVDSVSLDRKPSISQLRLRGTRSAQAMYIGSQSKSPESKSSTIPQRSALGSLPIARKARLDLILDERSTAEPESKRYSGYYDQVPKSSPAIGVGGQSSHPELRTAYQRQQHIDRNLKTLPPLPKTFAQTQKTLSVNKQESFPATNYGNDPNAGRPEDRNRLDLSSTLKLSGTTTSKPKHIPLAQISPMLSTHGNLPTVQTLGRTPHQRSAPQANAKIMAVPAPIIRPTDVGIEQKAVSDPKLTRTVVPSSKQSPPRSESHGSEHTQIWSPKLSTDSEPNFDGFSDVNEPGTDYFPVHKPLTSHTRNSSLNSTLYNESPSGSGQSHSHDRPLNGELRVPSKAIVARGGEQKSPSQNTNSSMVTSNGGQRSESSVSSLSGINGHSRAGHYRSSLENAKEVNHADIGERSWRLPEIREDHGFSPSIFEDKEGREDGRNLDETDLEITIGQISSGKDVVFDDAASELSAALPPPITRFRDDEDEFNANMAKLFGEGGDHAITKKGSHSVGRSATKKTKGFFSKFRSKS